MKILIDRNIERNAITERTVLEPQFVKWGSLRFTVPVAKPLPCPPRDDEERRLEDVPCLVRLRRHAEAGRIQFFISNELRMEAFRQKIDDPGYCGVNLLEGINIKSIPCPIERPMVVSSNGASIGVTEAEQMEFFQSIQHPRFQQIASAVGPSRIDDAFHLWTAEEAKLDVFLTMDYKFWRAVSQKREDIASTVKVLRPIELADHLTDILNSARHKSEKDSHSALCGAVAASCTHRA